MTQRPTLHPVAVPLGVDDEALARINKALGIPALVTPAAKPPPAGQDMAQDAPNPEPLPSPSPKSPTPKKPAPAAKLAPPTVKLSVTVPGYVSDALNVRAAQERSTARHIVMQGLVAIGFQIDPADLVPDGRRPEHKPKRR